MNEKCLDRYLLTWLTADNVQDIYESYAIFRDEKAISILPKLASDLNTILFALPIDVAELNVDNKKQGLPKSEPIIAVPNTSQIVKSSSNRRNIDCFEETMKSREVDKTETQIPIPNPTSVYESAVDYSMNVPDYRESISICELSIDKDDDTTSLSSSPSDEESAVAREPSKTSTNETVKINMEQMIEKQRQQISELENKVLDLTLENSRLRNMLADSSNQRSINSLGNFQIAIPRAVLNKTKTKNFYIYEINIHCKDDNERWTIFKRYRDFYKFHKSLKQKYVQIKVLDFPPKKKIFNLDFEFVEERRQRLQVYLRHVINSLPELANCSSKSNLEAKCSFFKS